MSEELPDGHPEALAGETEAVGEDWTLIFQESVREEIELYEREYRVTGNPVYAWRAIQVANFARLHYPTWIRDYLHNCALALCSMVDRPPKEKVAAAVARAVGLVKGGKTGAGSCFSDLSDTAWERHAAMVERCIGEGDKDYQAWDRVAKMYGVSQATIRRAYLKLLAFRKSRLPENEHCGAGDLSSSR